MWSTCTIKLCLSPPNTQFLLPVPIIDDVTSFSVACKCPECHRPSELNWTELDRVFRPVEMRCSAMTWRKWKPASVSVIWALFNTVTFATLTLKIVKNIAGCVYRAGTTRRIGDGYNAHLRTVNGKLALTLCLCLELTLTLTLNHNP